MTRRIPKRIREDAALLCAMAASNNCQMPSGAATTQCYWLATEAFIAAPYYDVQSGIRLPWHEQWAEAEAMLRTGWGP